MWTWWSGLSDRAPMRLGWKQRRGRAVGYIRFVERCPRLDYLAGGKDR